MRNNLLLLPAFTLAAALAMGAHDAEAKKTATKNISPAVAYAINTKGCQFPKPNPFKDDWGWPSASLTVQYIPQADGTYKIVEFPGAKNPDTKLPIASITKMMTALVIFDLIKDQKFTLDQKILVTKESLCLMKDDNKFAVKGLPAGITEIDAHHAMGQMIRKSSNTMAVNLAIAAAGSVEKFVELMNAKAKDLGMKNTHYINTNGLPRGDRKSEYTTARDLAILGAHLLPHIESLHKYESEPLQTWTIPEKLYGIKLILAELGVAFKSATIDECSSFMTLVKRGPYIMGNFQLCEGKNRLQIALNAVKQFKPVAEMNIIPPGIAANASPSQLNDNSNTETVSLRQAQP